MMDENSLVVFQDKKIRRIWHDKEWYFSVVDIAGVLIEQEDSQKARKYWNKLSQRLREEGSEVVTNCHRLKLVAEDGKLRLTDCANTKSLFRIIQSIPSKKAEPFKQWLAKVGYERVEEIQNPELAQKRMKELYKKKDILMIGLKKEYGELPYGTNSLMSGRRGMLKEKKNMQFLRRRFQKRSLA